MYKKYMLLAIILLSLATAAQCAENTAGNEKSDITFDYDSYIQKLKEGRQIVIGNENTASSGLIGTLGSVKDDCSNPAITLAGWKYDVSEYLTNDADLYDWIGVELTKGKYRIDLSFDADLDVYVYGGCFGTDGYPVIKSGITYSPSSEQIDFTIASDDYYKIKVIDQKSEYGSMINWNMLISPIPDVTLAYPVDDAKITDSTPDFGWNSNDLDGDSLTNVIYISKNKRDLWESPLYMINRGTKTYYSHNTPLSEGTYYWGVMASDEMFDSKSDVWSFRVDSPLPDLSITSADITFEKVI